MLLLKEADLGHVKLSYNVFGQGKVNLIIELALGATAGEWWHIASKLSEKYTVLLYERCRSITPARTPKNIAIELYDLLKQIPHENQLIIIAHSQGGLYAQQFTRLYPDLIKGIVFIDPLSAHDNNFKDLLTPQEMRQSGVDKSSTLSSMKLLAKLNLGFIIKNMIKKGPPFCYYGDFSEDARASILSSVAKPCLPTSAMEEYRLAHEPEEITSLMEKFDFPDVPIVLITHTKEYAIKETMTYGKTTKELAEKVEAIWQSVMKDYLKFSKFNKHIEAINSGHFIHLTEPEQIDHALTWIEINGQSLSV